jgi:hypothetical protein
MNTEGGSEISTTHESESRFLFHSNTSETNRSSTKKEAELGSVHRTNRSHVGSTQQKSSAGGVLPIPSNQGRKQTMENSNAAITGKILNQTDNF